MSLLQSRTWLWMWLLVGVVWMAPQAAQAYSVSYGYLLATGYDEDDPEYKDATPPSLHQLVITDGYCVFLHQGAFNRVCFEGGPGFRFDPFAFDIHATVTFHAIWLKPVIYGLFINTGMFVTAYPDLRVGLRLSLGFHLYFIAPGVEVQLDVDDAGRGDAKVFFQVTIPIPTASINFALGNFGL